jgi:alginate O-acetyltransferase complex protein AlgI
MLFNSYEFLFVFLPVALIGLYLMAHLRQLRAAIWWTGLASLVFYALGDVRLAPLLIASIGANYLLGGRIMAARAAGHARAGRLWLIAGVAANLALLGYFKYTNFFLDNVAAVAGLALTMPQIVLPVGISFYTFTQIAFLVDCGRGEGHRYKFSDYLLFVSFFPHLVAGPILNHKSVVPQLESTEFGRPDARAMYMGALFFAIGLFKKVIIADALAPNVRQVFDNVPQLNLVEAWGGALLYTFQLYYDFSSYSEMAVGLALLLNVRIPINFNSPYKAISLIDFWRRWHISLSNFLRDYLYIPLGGNRLGQARRYFNLLTTMVLGGLWHGAGWTFLAWGAMHGTGLAINHAFNAFWRGPKIPAFIGWPATFLFVVLAWVFFRAETIGDALGMFEAMFGLRGMPDWNTVFSVKRFIGDPLETFALLGVLTAWVIVAPNTQQMAESPKPRVAFAAAAGLLAAYAVLNHDRASDFLYFRF